MALNIPSSNDPRVVIIGAGFAGLKLARKLVKNNFQVVLFDKNNFHQFQPLFYQVAMAGLEPSSISFPLRKVFQKNRNVIFRPLTVNSIDPENNEISTDEGDISYDHLVIATGAITNFYGNKEIEKLAFGLKNIQEALHLRNEIFLDLERSLIKESYEERQKYIDIVIVGGGPTGVEIAGALAEMRNHILPKDYTELDSKEVDIYLIQMDNRLLSGMSENSGKKSLEFLEELGVKVHLNTGVIGYDGQWVELNNGEKIEAGKLIWCAGVRASKPEGLSDHVIDQRTNRILIDDHCRVEGYSNIYALGDVSILRTEDYPKGHPQVAQVAIQQAVYLSKNLVRGKLHNGFRYKDKGSMATIGRNKAVVDLPKFQFSGFIAWIVWLVVHLMALIGAKNKVMVMINWLWNYITYDQSLRLIIKPLDKKE